MSSVELIRSHELTDAAPYAYAAVTPAGRTVWTAGACPLDREGQVVAPGDVARQAQCVMENLGVNPSLTITAQAERAMAFWPNRGEPDPRPDLGSTYQRLEPVAPAHPVVPDGAPGALRLPIVSIT